MCGDRHTSDRGFTNRIIIPDGRGQDLAREAFFHDAQQVLGEIRVAKHGWQQVTADLPAVLLNHTVQELPLPLRPLDGEVTALDRHQHFRGGTECVQGEQVQIGGAIQDADVVTPRERTQDTKQTHCFLTGQLVEWHSLNFSQLTACRKNIKAILNRDREVIPRDLRGRVRTKQPCQSIVDSTVGNAKPRCTMGLRVQINQKNTLA